MYDFGVSVGWWAASTSPSHITLALPTVLSPAFLPLLPTTNHRQSPGCCRGSCWEGLQLSPSPLPHLPPISGLGQGADASPLSPLPSLVASWGPSWSVICMRRAAREGVNQRHSRLIFRLFPPTQPAPESHTEWARFPSPGWRGLDFIHPFPVPGLLTHPGKSEQRKDAPGTHTSPNIAPLKASLTSQLWRSLHRVGVVASSTQPINSKGKDKSKSTQSLTFQCK